MHRVLASITVRVPLALAALIVCAALLAGCGDDPVAPPPAQPIAFGEALPAGLRLAVVAPSGDWREDVDLATRCGDQATVFYAWSVPCPCVESVEPRIRTLMEQFDTMRGVAWLALAGEPLDRREQYREKLLRLDAQYPLIEDPEQVLCNVLSIDAACVVAVLDKDRRLVYRGPIDDDYVKGAGQHLKSVLESVLAGRAVEPHERARTYGCVFNDPASCTQLRAPATK